MDITNAQRASILVEALPYIQDYTGRIAVIKYGGNAMVNEEIKDSVMRDIVLLNLIGVKVVLVHGGGPEITEMLQRVGKESKFVNGLRVTDAETVEIVQMVLAGKVNKSLVNLIQNKGGKAIGLSGMDGHLIEAKVRDPELGFVGEITKVNVQPLLDMLDKGYIPVVSTLGCDNDGNVYNINADTAAARIAGVDRRYDSDGNEIERRYVGTDGNTTTGTDGTAILVREYDDNQQVIREEYRDTGNRRAVQERLGFCTAELKYDDGSVTGITFYDAHDDRKYEKDLFTEVHIRYDKNITRKSYYDKDGQKTNCSKGYAVIEYAYDGDGNRISEKYYDADGLPVNNDQGFAGIQFTRDTAGRAIQEIFLDTEGKPARAEGPGCAGIGRTFDLNGVLTEAWYLDAQGSPAAASGGCAGIKIVPDEKGRQASRTFVDPSGSPIVPAGSDYAKVTYEYDEKGREIRTSYFDEKDRPASVPQGPAFAGAASVIEKEYNDSGNVVVTRRYSSGTLIHYLQGYAWLEKEYNEDGMAVRETMRNEDGSPFTNTQGYATVRKEYDEKGNVILTSFYNKKDKPVTISSGWAAVREDYDGDGQVIRTDYLDKDGKPAVLEDGTSSVLFDREDGGSTVTESWLDAEGRTFVFRGEGYEYAAIRRIAEDPDHLSEIQYCDKDGKITAGPSGYALQTFEYDEMGRLTGIAWFDSDMEAFTNEKGFAAEIITYAEDGTRTETYLDEKGKVVRPE